MIEAADLRVLTLFDGVSDDQLGELVALGTTVEFAPGDVVFREAEPADDWWVLVDGSLDLVRHVGREENHLGTMGSPGQWAGGFRAWDENGTYLATGRAAAAGRVLRVPAASLRDWSGRMNPFGAHLVDGLFHSARSFESATRQREALVALGTLAAGLAHELNNPAAAATRAVDSLGATCDTLLSSLGRLAQGSISAEQFGALDALRQQIHPAQGTTDPLAVADREEALADWLGAHGVERGWVIAPPLAEAGVDVAWCEQAAGLLDDGVLEPALEWVASTLSAETLLAQVKESTRRVSDLVAAVRSYSQLDRASMHETDLAEGLESTLVILAHRIPDGVTVERDYGDDVPRIDAVAGELNQVWTNLIDNAVDAMGGQGVLRLSTRVDGDDVVVEVADTGSGLSDEAQKRAFEPFFTTKGVGKGTGLGLDISRRIVDRHDGRITFESKPGRTVLRVALPRARPSSR